MEVTYLLFALGVLGFVYIQKTVSFALPAIAFIGAIYLVYGFFTRFFSFFGLTKPGYNQWWTGITLVFFVGIMWQSEMLAINSVVLVLKLMFSAVFGIFYGFSNLF